MMMKGTSWVVAVLGLAAAPAMAPSVSVSPPRFTAKTTASLKDAGLASTE